MPIAIKPAVAARIAELNDQHRRAGRFTITQGVASLPPDQQLTLCRLVMEFNEFDESNDPYGEHDFGAIEMGGENYFWKIDYYDLDMEMGSDDAADPSVTRRVLTLLRADE